MTEPMKDLESELLSLPAARRAQLAERLIDSLEADWENQVDDIWMVEAERRLDELESGAVRGIPPRDVIAEARSKLR